MIPERDRLLRLSLWLAAGYDAGVALLLLATPLPLAAVLALVPPELVYLRLLGVLLLMLAACYAMAASDLGAGRPRIAVAAIAIAGRMTGAVVLGAEGFASQRAAFLELGAADLAIGGLHVAGLLACASSRSQRQG